MLEIVVGDIWQSPPQSFYNLTNHPLHNHGHLVVNAWRCQQANVTTPPYVHRPFSTTQPYVHRPFSTTGKTSHSLAHTTRICCRCSGRETWCVCGNDEVLAGSWYFYITRGVCTRMRVLGVHSGDDGGGIAESNARFAATFPYDSSVICISNATWSSTDICCFSSNTDAMMSSREFAGLPAKIGCR